MNIRLPHCARQSIYEIVSASAALSVAIGVAALVYLPSEALTQSYTDNRLGFQVLLPADFTTREFSEGDTQTFAFENSNGDGIQLVISPWDEQPDTLTPERIIHDTNLNITEVVPMHLNSATGYTFRTDNDAFDGASTEAWFIHEGHVYQFSTYTKNERLLRAVLSSWKFFVNRRV